MGKPTPLANAIVGNPTYNSISKLKESPIPVYTLHGIAPELLWDYGRKTTRISKAELQSKDLSGEFGVIAATSEDKDVLQFLEKSYKVEFRETFDLNPVDSTKRGHKGRLKTDYYIVKKLEK